MHLSRCRVSNVLAFLASAPMPASPNRMQLFSLRVVRAGNAASVLRLASVSREHRARSTLVSSTRRDSAPTPASLMSGHSARSRRVREVRRALNASRPALPSLLHPLSVSARRRGCRLPAECAGLADMPACVGATELLPAACPAAESPHVAGEAQCVKPTPVTHEQCARSSAVRRVRAASAPTPTSPSTSECAHPKDTSPGRVAASSAATPSVSAPCVWPSSRLVRLVHADRADRPAGVRLADGRLMSSVHKLVVLGDWHSAASDPSSTARAPCSSRDVRAGRHAA
mmetsp:Transcript_1352/g.3705  ORF Transcript_1352/g.3705 Transcript_1352/m.3705 type:complete len:286 (+) Transcript_1352:331-1188(+)